MHIAATDKRISKGVGTPANLLEPRKARTARTQAIVHDDRRAWVACVLCLWHEAFLLLLHLQAVRRAMSGLQQESCIGAGGEKDAVRWRRTCSVQMQLSAISLRSFAFQFIPATAQQRPGGRHSNNQLDPCGTSAQRFYSKASRYGSWALRGWPCVDVRPRLATPAARRRFSRSAVPEGIPEFANAEMSPVVADVDGDTAESCVYVSCSCIVNMWRGPWCLLDRSRSVLSAPRACFVF